LAVLSVVSGGLATRGQFPFTIFIACLALLLFILIFEIVDDLDIFGQASDAIAGVFGVPAGSFAGWLALVIVAGAVLLMAGGTVTLIKNALGQFKG